jgi:hypothetical protein
MTKSEKILGAYLASIEETILKHKFTDAIQISELRKLAEKSFTAGRNYQHSMVDHLVAFDFSNNTTTYQWDKAVFQSLVGDIIGAYEKTRTIEGAKRVRKNYRLSKAAKEFLAQFPPVDGTI